MSNLLNHDKHNTKLFLNKDYYWDFFLNEDDFTGKFNFSIDEINKKLISLIDFSDKNTFDGQCIKSSNEYSWSGALTTEDNILYNIGYTAVDNGFIEFDKNKISNSEFLKLYQGSEFTTPLDESLHLCPVTSNTQMFKHEIEVLDDSVKFNSGFYQGFFMDECDTYQVLPKNIDNDLSFAFTLMKSDFEEVDGLTLNKKYPDNKGLFFYIGTRAENKWWKYYKKDKYEFDNELIIKLENDYTSTEYSEDYIKYYEDLMDLLNYTQEENGMFGEQYTKQFDENNDDENYLSNYNYLSDYYENKTEDYELDGYTVEDVNLNEIEFKTEDGYPLFVDNIKIIETDNKFLTFNRTEDGYRANEEFSEKVTFWSVEEEYVENLFLMVNRTPTGYNTTNVEELKDANENSYYQIRKDLYDNALGFQIKDDGSIGFKYISSICDENEIRTINFISEFSKPGLIEKDVWYSIYYRLRKTSEKNMKIYIYLNGDLVYVSSELNILNLRKLDDISEKQEGVAYNISLGGGTQGLSSVIYPDYMSLPEYELPLEKFFGGTFIGYIKNFKIYNGLIESQEIRNIYKNDVNEIFIYKE